MSRDLAVAELLVSLGRQESSVVSEEGKATDDVPQEDAKPSATKPRASAELSAEAEPSGTAASADSSKQKRKYKKRVKDPVHVFEVEPRVIQAINKSKTVVDHSYRDFSVVPKPDNYVAKVNIADMSFGEKIHSILGSEKFSLAITWLPHGRAFKVIAPLPLERQVLKEYFGHGRYSTFLSDLKQHDFKLITKGPDRNSYYHEVSVD